MLQFVNHAFESFFELAAVHRAGHKRAHVELEQALVHERRRDVAVHDALGETFYNGCLAHARLTDQRRVVLGSARQDLDDTLDLHLASYHGVQFLLFGFRRQVGSQLVDQRRFGIRRRAA